MAFFRRGSSFRAHGNDDAVGAIQELKTLPKAPEALALLRQVVQFVRPVMHKRGWRVGLVKEMAPTRSRVLGFNINAGEEVHIRLRRDARSARFFALEELIGTMLHELCHIEHGPHNHQFYTLLDEITAEAERQPFPSSTPPAFPSEGGHRLGASRAVHAGDCSPAAAAAAERRARLAKLAPSTPHRLGSSVVGAPAAVSPAVAAREAALRRHQDVVWCGGGPPLARGKANAHNRVVEEEEEPAVGAVEVVEVAQAAHKGQARQRRNHETLWRCGVCTLLNPTARGECDACGSVREVVVIE